MNTATPTLTRKVGQRVFLDAPGSRWHGAGVIVKINRTTIDIKQEASGRVVRTHPEGLRNLGKDEADPSVLGTPYTTLLEINTFSMGSLVRFVGRHAAKYPGVYVVIADKIDKVNVAKLGGDNDRYVRAPRAIIEAVSVESLECGVEI